MKVKVTGPNGEKRFLTADTEEAIHHAIQQMHGGIGTEYGQDTDKGPQTIDVASLEAEPEPTQEPAQEPPEAEPAEPDEPDDPSAPVVDALSRHASGGIQQTIAMLNALRDLSATLDGSIAAMGKEVVDGLQQLGVEIKASTAQQTQAMAALSEDLASAENEVVRDDNGRVKGSRRKMRTA